ncbi:hypothetical protein K438DRAFT_1796646 [Mycena galopus ATCC 62051]|nr:hypothetical protein K438DRAFT_1796646 [Mycena galopus ATCC 62051]
MHACQMSSTASRRAADRHCIAQIEAQIEALKRSIQALEATKLRVQERLHSYAYPVLTLPNEIISEIFIRFLPVYPAPPPLIGLLSPTLLTHICRRWREVALGTPALWRAISYPRREDQGPLLHILESWLSRSGCLPLSFLMEGIWGSLSKKSFETLVFHRARWEYIALGISESDILTVQGAMPLLQQLTIQAWADPTRPPSPIGFQETPRLRSVTLWQLSSSTDVLPWSQLTSLTLIYDLIECSAVLQHAINLIHCHLVALPDVGTISVPDVLLPRLESLVLTQLEAGDDAPTHYLETLITPALRTLEVSEVFLQPDPVDSLELFIEASGCRLQKLCITGNIRSISEVEYRSVFDQIPALSFDMSLADFDSYAQILDERRYIVL